MMVIPEHIRLQLGLRIVSHEEAEYATGHVEKVPIASPIEVHFANRRTVTDGMVLGNEVLWGAIVMEAMDVIIHPMDQKLIVNPANPTMPKMLVKGVRGGDTGHS
jgi:hypothetical protein